MTSCSGLTALTKTWVHTRKPFYIVCTSDPVDDANLKLTLNSLAVRFLFETSGPLGPEPAKLVIDEFQARASRNDYEVSAPVFPFFPAEVLY